MRKRGRNDVSLRTNVNSQHRLRPNSVEQRQVEGWVRDFARRAGLPDAVRHVLDQALEEWITNVISYAHEDAAGHWIDIRFALAGDEVRVEVEDDGREFNPLTLPPVDTTERLESRPAGGLGVHLIRTLMDNVGYRRENGRNILTLTKRFSRPAQ